MSQKVREDGVCSRNHLYRSIVIVAALKEETSQDSFKKHEKHL